MMADAARGARRRCTHLLGLAVVGALALGAAAPTNASLAVASSQHDEDLDRACAALGPFDKHVRMCTSQGECHERATAPTPRTHVTVNTRGLCLSWWQTHRRNIRLARQAEAELTAAEHRLHEKSAVGPAAEPPCALLMIGDSITESYVGTKLGQPAARCEGAPEALQAAFDPSEFAHSLVLAISGDQTQHLLWRLQNGELPPGLRRARAVVNLHIGTNNIGQGHTANETIAGVRAVASWLLHNSRASVLVNSLLPRNDRPVLKRICPPRCDEGGRPMRSFEAVLEETNRGLARVVAELSVAMRADAAADAVSAPPQHGGRIALASCGHIFRRAAPNGERMLFPSWSFVAKRQRRRFSGSAEARGSGEDAREWQDPIVARELMPDALHPNGEGHRRLLRCLRPQLLALRAAA